MSSDFSSKRHDVVLRGGNERVCKTHLQFKKMLFLHRDYVAGHIVAVNVKFF